MSRCVIALRAVPLAGHRSRYVGRKRRFRSRGRVLDRAPAWHFATSDAQVLRNTTDAAGATPERILCGADTLRESTKRLMRADVKANRKSVFFGVYKPRCLQAVLAE